jgi:hypothetical protein
MSVFEYKNPFKSLTIWGAILSLSSVLESLQSTLQLIPVEALPPKERAAVTAAVGVLGGILTIVGRYKASTKLGF